MLVSLRRTHVLECNLTPDQLLAHLQRKRKPSGQSTAPLMQQRPTRAGTPPMIQPTPPPPLPPPSLYHVIVENVITIDNGRSVHHFLLRLLYIL